MSFMTSWVMSLRGTALVWLSPLAKTPPVPKVGPATFGPDEVGLLDFLELQVAWLTDSLGSTLAFMCRAWWACCALVSTALVYRWLWFSCFSFLAPSLSTTFLALCFEADQFETGWLSACF
jgi:hypothetical protein